MSAKKEKVEIIRTEAFEAVDDELGLAMNALEESNARIAELLSTEARGDLPFRNEPAPAAPETPVPGPAPATPRLRRGRPKSNTEGD